ncbi:MAG: hypothetical protein ACLQU1_27200 [Bryobacteraceae bacterium]
MSRFAFHKSAVVGLLLFGSQFLVQAQTTSSGTAGLTVTTGIVGMTSTQTAQLNVLNLQAAVPGVTAAACPATLEFYDDTGALLKRTPVTNIPPATAASLVFKPAVPSTAANARAQIRAVVFTPLTSVATPVSGPGSTPVMPVMPTVPPCSVMSSLEIMDDATGDTHTFTTDLRAIPPYIAVPLPAVQ